MEKTPDEYKDLIIKFLQKEINAEEMTALERWLEEDEGHKDEFEQINKAYQASITIAAFDPGRVESAWSKLASRVEAEKENGARGRSLSNPYSLRNTTLLRWAASAALLISLGIALMFYLEKSSPGPLANVSVVTSNAGSKTELLLPDSSVVWLNSGSTIRYEDEFGKTNRKVFLTGEAFFDVRKAASDFEVITPNLTIQVKGTKFNVNTKGEGGTENTTLQEGRVVLMVNGDVHDMQPGDHISFAPASQRLFRYKVDPADYSAWKEESLVFDNNTLSEIIPKLENRYKISITADSVLAGRERLTMTITDEPIEEIIELIKLSSSLKASIRGKDITIYE